MLYDRHGKQLISASPRKQATGTLFRSIYTYPDTLRFRPRQYTVQDSEQGASSIDRDLCVRWSREANNQLPWVDSATKAMADFAVGDEYNPFYIGANEQIGKEYIDWLTEVFFPNCCLRGLDFRSLMRLSSTTLDVDGDFLAIYGEQDGEPRVQIIPCNRISSQGENPGDVFFVQGERVTKGPYPNSMLCDGVVYDVSTGTPLAFRVVNSNNVVNTVSGNQEHSFFSTKDSQLIRNIRWFDRGRGFPSISAGVLDALSVQEITAYVDDAIKQSSLYAVIEKTPSGEGPLSEEIAAQRLLSEGEAGGNVLPLESSYGNQGAGNLLGGTLAQYPSTALGYATPGLRVVDGPSIKYITTQGDVKTLDSHTPSAETLKYLNQHKEEVMLLIGVPRAVLYPPESAVGRLSDGISKVFNFAVKQRQNQLDKFGKFIMAWAVSKAIKNGDLPPNDDESLLKIFSLTHPEPFSLNESYDRRDDLNYYEAGLKSMDDIARKNKTSAEAVITQIEKENVMFFKAAKKVSEETGVDLNIVLANMKRGLKQMPQMAMQEATNENT